MESVSLFSPASSQLLSCLLWPRGSGASRSRWLCILASRRPALGKSLLGDARGCDTLGRGCSLAGAEEPGDAGPKAGVLRKSAGRVRASEVGIIRNSPKDLKTKRIHGNYRKGV